MRAGLDDLTVYARERRARAVDAARRDAEAFAGGTTRALRDARRATDRALGARASNFLDDERDESDGGETSGGTARGERRANEPTRRRGGGDCGGRDGDVAP